MKHAIRVDVRCAPSSAVATSLHAVAYRMLGSPSEADDAVQETWLRLARVDAGGVVNLGGWLRSRGSRREDLAGDVGEREILAFDRDPEQEAVLADSVGRALLVVLDRLGPAERVGFVLQDMFAVPPGRGVSRRRARR